MDDKIIRMLDSPLGRKICDAAERMIELCGIDLSRGVLVGFSGGPDSVMLLSVLAHMRSRRHFKLVAAHINHCIRGDEADRDETFAKKFSCDLNVEFLAHRIDVPLLASESGVGMEEAARNARYSTFFDILSGRTDLGYIATAHNASDNLETVVFNLLRGAGARGMSGIPPMRDNIIRPLLGVAKKDILAALDCFSVEYAIDSTNESTDYSRNYIRHNIVPTFKKICDDPETMIQRMANAVRTDDDYIASVADSFLNENSVPSRNSLCDLHPAVFSRVVKRMAEHAGVSVFDTHINKIRDLLINGETNFSYSVVGGVWYTERNICRFCVTKPYADEYSYVIEGSHEKIPEFSADVWLSDTEFEENFLNVHNFSIQADITSAIIVGRLHIRSRNDGDFIFYGGHRRKLKKLFCDLKIPLSKRHLIPILCDDNGVVWVPGFKARDDGGTVPRYVAIACSDENNRFYFGCEFRK